MDTSSATTVATALIAILMLSMLASSCAEQCAHPNGDVPVSGNDCQCGAVSCSAGRYCTAAESFCATGPTCANTEGTGLNDGVTCKCGTVECDGSTQYAPSVGYFAPTGSSTNPRSEVTGMFCFASENRCAHGPKCTNWKKLANDASLQSRSGAGIEDGVNYLMQSCTVHADVSVSNGQTLKISKGPAVALDTEIILDRRKGHDNGGCSANGHCGGTPVGVGRHFRVSAGGKLELTRLTFIGGNYRGSGNGGFLQLSGGEAILTDCILANNLASNGGAIAISGNAKLTCNGCTLKNNAAKMGGSGGTGGGLYISSGEAKFIDSMITGSKAMTYANGLVPYGPAIAIYGSSSSVKMYHSSVHGNLGRRPIYMHTNVASDSLTLINMGELQSNLIEGASNRATSCSSGPNTCKDNGFWDPCTQITPHLTCSTALAIDTVSCNQATAAGATRQATECATTGTLHVSLGLVSGHLLGTPDKVLIGSSAECTITSSSETWVNCTVAASALWGTAGLTTGTPSVTHTSSNAEGHLIQIINVNGDSTYLEGQSPLPRLLFAAPNVSSSIAFLADTAGGESFTVKGSGFGPQMLTGMLNILIGGEHATQIAWISDSEISFVSPALSYNAKGNDPGFILTAAGVRHGFSWNPAESELGTGGQSWQQTNINVPRLFSYAPPSLDRVDSIKQSIETGSSGIPVILHGSGFADVNLTNGNVRIWTQKSGGGPQNQITCDSIVRISDAMLTCLYPDGGAAGCTDRNFYVTVSGQTTSNSVPLCYLAIGSVYIREAGQEVALSSVRLDEGKNAGKYLYDVVLSDVPEDDDNDIVNVTIASNSAACKTLSETLTFSRSSWSIPQRVVLHIAEDTVDQEDTNGNLFASCTIAHTISSTNPVYNDSAIGPQLRLDIIDDDIADSKIRPTTIRSSSLQQGIDDTQIKIENYYLKFLGPLTMVEGGSDFFGVQLDTKPSAEVMLRLDVAKPRENTPASVSVTPSSFVFRPDEWNVSQVYMAEVKVAQDDVDSAADLEDFTLTYSVSTADSVYAQKASNLTIIVRVQDDDTAGINFDIFEQDGESTATTLELIEGDTIGSILTIRSLSTRPLADVTLDISSSLDSLIQFDRRVINVSVSNWNRINTNVTIRALEGNYGGKTTATIFVTPRSDGDPNYNGSDARGEQPVAIALRACGAGHTEVSTIINNSTSKCTPCPAGKYKGSLDEICRMCLPGTFGPRAGLPACSECIPGKFQPHQGKISCHFCEKGRFQPEPGKGTCRDHSSTGEFVPPSIASGGDGGGVESKSVRLGYHATGCNNSGGFCTGEDPCPAGTKGMVPATHKCVLCPPGKHSPGGLTSCGSCEPGKFSAQNGSVQCVDCNVSLGLYADVENAADCKRCVEEEVSTGKECRPVSEDLSLQVPAEVKIRLVARESTSEFSIGNVSTAIEVSWRLTAGDQGSETPASYIVMLSPDSDFPASNRFTFSDLSRSGARLPVSQEMASSLTASVIYAKVRSVGRGLGMISPWSGSSLPWQTAETCSQSEYLATGKRMTSFVNLDPHTWRCELCPRGASCEGSITWVGVKPKFGFARCPQQPHRFEACLFQAACLGGRNGDLIGKFEQPDGTDPAVCNASTICPETCNMGYKNNSLLCSSCGTGFSHTGIGGKCDICPSHGENIGVMVLGFIGGIVAVCIFVRMTLGDAGEVVDTTDGVKNILLSFVQMLTLMTSFPIKWPPIFEAIFQVGGTVTVLGEQLVNLKCLVPSNSDADVFFAKSGAWALIPLVLMLTVTATWVIIARFRKVPKLRPKMLVSCIALLFLIYPTLCAACFNIFACRTVCDEDIQRLVADYDEQCWVGRHLAMILVFALPMLFAYVFGFPLVALLAIHRLQNKLIVARARGNFKRRSTLGERLATPGKETTSIVIPKKKTGLDHQVAVTVDNAQQRRKMKHHDQHFVLGMFYSSYRGAVWWWQATVALRKIGLALIGVFGSRLGLMQVHLTMLLLLVVIMITSKIEPYGGQNAKVMHDLELLTLLATWCTLWAGSVFNTYPKCQDPDGKMGDTLPWCNALSVLVGLFDIGVTMVCVVALFLMKRKENKERKIKPIDNTITMIGNSSGGRADEEANFVIPEPAMSVRAKPLGGKATEARSAETTPAEAKSGESNSLLPLTSIAEVSGPRALLSKAPLDSGHIPQLEVATGSALIDEPSRGSTGANLNSIETLSPTKQSVGAKSTTNTEGEKTGSPAVLTTESVAAKSTAKTAGEKSGTPATPRPDNTTQSEAATTQIIDGRRGEEREERSRL